MIYITPMQLKTLKCIHDWQVTHDKSPLLKEVAKGLKISLGGANYHIQQLYVRGMLKREGRNDFIILQKGIDVLKEREDVIS
jgi:predicted transcriptional regulator